MNKIFKTKYYPVNLDTKTIIDDPHARERDLAWKYRGCGVTGIKGERVLIFKCYGAYKIINTGAKETQ